MSEPAPSLQLWTGSYSALVNRPLAYSCEPAPSLQLNGYSIFSFMWTGP
jgi:hypothetical protein